MSRDQLIQWDDEKTLYLVNPRDPLAPALDDMEKLLPRLRGHIWICSSGTSQKYSSVTLYALSRSAFLHSARAVNEHLEVHKKDVWLNVLPVFHVGGLSIQARSYLSRSKVVEQSQSVWNPQKFKPWILEAKATLTSLVPTQIFDLVKLGEKAPESLRAIVVGGGRLSPELYKKARALGYPVLPSYGMTECASQIATAPLGSLLSEEYPQLKILSHVQARIEEGRLAVSTPSLFTSRAVWRSTKALVPITDESIRLEIDEPEVEILRRAGDWYVTQDQANLDGEYLTLKGRVDEQIKISGELVHLGNLNELFRTISSTPESWIFHIEREREGAEIQLVLPIQTYNASRAWIEKFNSSTLPVAKIKSVYYVDSIPKSELGKIKIIEVKRRIGL